ncbi:hypothetical protein L596_018228 [Steinernema carpocapsae]|uniref:Histone-lysine N-methyltransferase n=1 Tax=Steinernema carpocapsae TaxID=34508 RepID=A0A4V6A200_STECR|nr:hypothetical protein L596_018228 [Steinernema carpocapsae]
MIPYVNGKYISKVPGGSFIKSISGKEFTVDDVNVALAEKPKGKCHAGTRVSARIGAQQLCSKAIRTGWYSGTVLECMNDKRTGKPCYTVLFDGDFTINIGIDHVRVLVEQPLEVNPRKRTSEGVHYQLAYKNCWQLQPKGSNIRFFMRAYMEAYPDWEKMRMPERENFKRVAVENKRGLPCSAIRLQLDNGCALMRFPKGTENCTKWPCAEHEHEDEWMFRGDPRFLALNENRLMFENAKISEMGGESSSDSGISMMPATPSSRRHRVQNLPVERATRSSTPEAAVAPGRKVQTARKTSRRAASARNHKKPSKEVNRQIQQTNKDTMERECEFILHDLPEWAERYCRFEPHDECGKKCIEQIRERDPAHVSYHNMSPYLIPLKCGWSRVRLCTTLKQKGAPRLSRIIYQAPCGESYYDFASIFKFLQLSGSLLTIDLFTFEEQLDLLVYAQPRKEYVKSPDFCQDMENIRIPVLNSTRPEEPIPTLIYSRVSRPGRITSDVPERERFLTQSKEFCSGCSCVDDCSDPTKCDCLKLNISTMERLFETLRIDQIGYKHKLISEIACAGIFECNDNCKCHRNRESKKKCLNTVVQLDMKFPLQLFRTPECGWGVRTTVDIPKGAFIANYCGDIYTDAEIEAHPMPDDYYADLDLVDSVENEKRKQGIDLIGLDENEVPHKRKRSTKNDAGKVKFSFDDYFKEGGDHLFIVDAMKRGNIGKFFNHSCNPNMFVQHVLVDTHDIRLPWVSFFAKRHIHAGDELCWNYGYQIGTITNKFLYCKCGSNKCEGRLL